MTSIFWKVLYEASVDSGEKALEFEPRCTELLTTAVGTITQGTTIHLVIDGIDECDLTERKKISSSITTILREDSQQGRVRAIFTSQPEPDIRSLLRKATILGVTETITVAISRNIRGNGALKSRKKLHLRTRDAISYIPMCVVVQKVFHLTSATTGVD